MKSILAPFFIAAVIAGDHYHREHDHDHDHDLLHKDYIPTIDLVTWQNARAGRSAYPPAIVASTAGRAVVGSFRGIVPMERSPLRCACPTGYILNGDRCEHSITSSTEAICPLGYAPFDVNTCVKQTFPEEKCNFGFARVGNECIRRDIMVPELACPAGYAFESTASFSPSPSLDELICLKRIAVNTEFECPDGTNFAGQCTTPIQVPALYQCPPGYTPGPANTCSRVEQVECGPTASSHHLRRLEGIEEHVAAAKAHHADKWKLWGTGTETRITPTTQVLRVQQTCTADITIPATSYCERGQLRGQLCIEQTPVDPVRVCPAFGNVADCYAYDRVNPRATCPAGFHEECAVTEGHGIRPREVDCECVRSFAEPVQLFCPAGAELLDGLCTITARPFVGCPVGSHLMDGACETTEYATPICTYQIEFACQGAACDTPV